MFTLKSYFSRREINVFSELKNEAFGIDIEKEISVKRKTLLNMVIMAWT